MIDREALDGLLVNFFLLLPWVVGTWIGYFLFSSNPSYAFGCTATALYMLGVDYLDYRSSKKPIKGAL